MRINGPNGTSYPLSEIAYLEYGTANQVINPLEGEREIRVEARMPNIGVSAPSVISELQAGILAELTKSYPSVSQSAEGQSRESEKMGGGAGLVFPVIMTVMLALIVLAFNSFSQALLTFALYPFAFIGVILGHWIRVRTECIFHHRLYPPSSGYLPTTASSSCPFLTSCWRKGRVLWIP